MVYKGIGLLALIYSGMTCAGTMGEADTSSWSIAGKALYLKPVGAVNSVSPGSVTSTLTGNTLYGGSAFPYSWGVNIDAQYNFNSKYDVNANWYYLNSSTSFTTNNPNRNTTNLSALGSITISDLVSQNSNTQDWNAVNLEFGRMTNLDDILNVRIHAGGQYARIKSTATFKSTANVTLNSILLTLNNIPQSMNYGARATVNAFGPRVGVDLSRELAYGKYATGVDIYAKGAAGVLAGPNNYRISSKLLNNSIYNARSSSISVIPEFEGKLGLMYGREMYRGTLTADVGWMWTSYLNLNSDNQAYLNSSFSVEGLYFGLRWLA